MDMVCMVATVMDMNQVATELDMALEVALGMVEQVGVKDLATDMAQISLVATVRVEAMMKVVALAACLAMMEEVKEIMDWKGLLVAMGLGMELMVMVVTEKVVGMEVVAMDTIMGKGFILDLASVA